MRIVLVISLIVCCLPVIGQVDSLHSSDPFDYINKANELTAFNAEEALDMAERGMAIALKEENQRAEAYCLNTLGSIYYALSKYNLALESFASSHKLFQAIGETNGEYLTIKYLAQSYEANKNTDKAIEHYERFITLATERGQDTDVDEAKEALGRLYFNTGKYDLALGIFEVQKKKLELSGNTTKLAEVCNWIGQIYDIRNDSTAAMKYFDEGLQNGINSNNEQAVWGYYDNVNKFYGSRGNSSAQIQANNAALDYYNNEKEKQSKKKKKREKDDEDPEFQQQVDAVNNSLYQSNFNMAQVYMNTNNPVDAIPYIKNSIDLAADIGVLENEVQGYEALVEAYEQVGEYDKALEAYKNFVKSKDSLDLEREKEKLLALRLEADLYDRDKRIRLLQKEAELNHKQFDLIIKERDDAQIFIYSLLAGFGILLISFFLFIRGNREKRKANKLLMLKSLRTQMNPHFIFNSLNSVNSFISQSDERSANKYLSEFSRLMRMVLENSKHDFVPLNSEVKTLELYLGLEHLRFKDKFDYEFSLDVQSMEDVEVPPMLVQPYIENAVWHGLRYSEGKGTLKVSCTEHEDELFWVIEDNGIGRKKSKELKTKHQREGKSTGMKNIEERLRIIKELYGQDLKLKVSDLTDDGIGTRVELIIPKRKAV